MAVSELFVCDQCDSDVVLVHAEEWQPGPRGEILPYPGYGLVGGLVNRLWCPQCRKVQPFAFVHLVPPGDHPVIAYAEAQRQGNNGTETGPCPTCHTPLTWQLDGESCPHCPDGTLHFTGEWESGS